MQLAVNSSRTIVGPMPSKIAEHLHTGGGIADSKRTEHCFLETATERTKTSNGYVLSQFNRASVAHLATAIILHNPRKRSHTCSCSLSLFHSRLLKSSGTLLPLPLLYTLLHPVNGLGSGKFASGWKRHLLSSTTILREPETTAGLRE